MAQTTAGRVLKPKNPEEGLKLADKVYKKHMADGANSELKNLVDSNWDEVGPTIAEAREHHERAERLKGEMEAEYRLRDAAYAPIRTAIDDSARYLKGKYSKNPKKLAEWGYEIDDTKQSPKSPK